MSLRGVGGLGGGLEYWCRFGHAVVAATYDTVDGAVRCTSPHAHVALSPLPDAHQSFYGGVSLEHSGDGAVRLDFSDEEASEWSWAARPHARIGYEWSTSAWAPLGVTVDLTGAAAVRSGALRLTDADKFLSAEEGSARLHLTSARPPLQHLTLAFDALMTGPLPASAASAYPHGLCVSFGGPRMPLHLDLDLDLAAVGTRDGEQGAASAEAAGVRVLLGYGAARDVNATNATISTFVRVVHVPAGGLAVRDHMRWLPDTQLSSRSWRRMQLVIVASMLSLWLDGEKLLEDTPLAEWAPAASWSVGFWGSRGSLAHVQWIDNVQIASGALRSAAEVPVFLSRNGQQFDSLARHTFGYRAPPIVSHLAPRVGAADANTSVIVHGSNFAGGSDYRCVFGGVYVPAVYNLTDSTVSCQAPPRDVEDEEVVSASIALNGIDPGVNGSFQYVNSSASRAVPASGPVEGGTVVIIHGHALAHGHDCRCRFGTVETPASMGGDGALKCISPAANVTGAAPSGGVVPIHLTLNGQDFHFATPPLQFTYYDPPMISSMTPPSGPSGGRTVVTLFGRGFGGGTPLLQCRFGGSVVVSEANATDGRLVCRTPHATAAGAGLELSEDDCALRGGAVRINGTVQLTAPGRFDSEGSLLCGSDSSPLYPVPCTLCGSASSPLYGAASHHFEVTFELTLGRGGQGASFSFGDLQEGGLGADGASMGLRVQLHTQAPRRISVLYDDIQLYSRLLPLAEAGPAADDGALSEQFVPLVIAYGRAAHGGDTAGLTLLFDGVALLRGIEIPRWSPQPSWRFGIAARSGSGAANCRVRRIRLRAGSFVAAHPTPLHVTRNGQDFVTAAPHPFSYHGQPVVSSIAPSSGPTSGGSRLLIAGEALLGGSAYTCRFGAALVAPVLNTTEAAPFAHCETPAGLTAGVLAPQLSLNGQNETSSAVTFRLYAPPVMSAVSPSSGPALGGTLVLLLGSNLSALGSQPVCRFGRPLWSRGFGALSVLTSADSLGGPLGVAQRAAHGLAPNEVPATIVNSTHAQCVSPASTIGPQSSESLELSLNGHDFTDAALAFHYYARVPVVSSVFPISDSSIGGRSLTLAGRGFTNGSQTLCRFRGDRFGVQRLEAEALTDSTLVCGSPTLPSDADAALDSVSSALPLVLDVTLNGQQYSAPPPVAFHIIAGVESSPRLLGSRPSLGPVNGSTVVIVSGLVMRFGSWYLCKFGESVVAASYDPPTRGVRCLTPPHAPATVQLAVSFNGRHYEPTTFAFTFYHEPGLTALSPMSGPALEMQCISFSCPRGRSVGTLVTVTGTRLDGGGVPSLYRCRFNATVVPATLISASAIRCHAPGSVAAGEATLRLSSNAQDFSHESLRFSFEPAILVSRIEPALGPASGGTNITLFGSHLVGGSHYQCRFGSYVSPAESVLVVDPADNASSTRAVTCSTPAWAPLDADRDGHRMELHRASMALSLNGQQFTLVGHYFAYYHDAELASISPNVGPVAGGLEVRLYGSRLDGGDRESYDHLWVSQLEDIRARSTYRCRLSNAASAIIATVAATWRASDAAVVCRTPPVDIGAQRELNASVAVSLNGLDFTATSVLFTYVASPTLDGLLPLSGPSLGGVVVTLTGSGFVHGLGLACAFDAAVVPASIHTASTLGCRSPSLGHANQRHEGVAYALDELPLQGAASLLQSAIRLTGPGSAEPGAVEMRLPVGAPPLWDFEVSLLLMLPAEAESFTATYRDDARLAFRYGPFPNVTFGGESSTAGLSVSVSDGGPPLVVTVRYAGATVLSRVLGSALPRATWMRLAVNVTEGALRVTNGGRVLVSDLVLPQWNPLRSWRMGVGAHGVRAGRYLSTVRLRSSLILGLASTPVQLLLHEQLYAGALSFGYTADAVVSSIEPASGPSTAPTPIQIGGANFNLGLAIACRFEQGGNSTLSPATLVTNASRAQINCTVDADVWAVGSIGVYVALGPEATFGPGTEFLRYATPTLHSLYPPLGVGNSTRVHIAGVGLTSGTDRRCLFGEWEAAASVLPPDGLVCKAPLNSYAGDVDVRVSLNGLQYTQVGAPLSFNYLTEGYVFVSAVSPRVGPVSGATNVSVYGSNFVHLPLTLSCSFGGAVVNATFLDEGTLLCESPPSDRVGGGVSLVQMSLNGQELYPGAEFLYSESISPVLGVAPSSKGQEGGGTALVTLADPLPALVVERGHFACRFGVPPCSEVVDPPSLSSGCVAVPATLVDAKSVRCAIAPSPVPVPVNVRSGVNVPLWVSSNGAQFTLGPTNFTYFEIEPLVHALEPPIGPIHGGTVVLVRGPGLTFGSGQPQCRFGGDVVPATRALDDSGVECASPSKALAVEVALEVSLNGKDWISNASSGSFMCALPACLPALRAPLARSPIPPPPKLAPRPVA